jgi:hypothetical protein
VALSCEVKLLIKAFHPQQLTMVANLRDAAPFHNDNSIHIHNRRKSVGYDEWKCVPRATCPSLPEYAIQLGRRGSQ